MMFLPPYSSQLNLIGGLWGGWLKRSVIDHVFFRSATDIVAAVDGFFERIGHTPMEITTASATAYHPPDHAMGVVQPFPRKGLNVLSSAWPPNRSRRTRRALGPIGPPQRSRFR